MLILILNFTFSSHDIKNVAKQAFVTLLNALLIFLNFFFIVSIFLKLIGKIF